MSPFFHSRQGQLKTATALYAGLLVFSHWQLPDTYVWYIAAFFSIAMNFTYLLQAISMKQSVAAETLVATALTVLSLLGILVSPLLVIAAIFGHGCWDLAKHFGSGVPFYFWYTCSCFVFDCIYSAGLLIYFFSL